MKKPWKRACSLREMKPTVNSCCQTKTLTDAETSLSQTCHDNLQHSACKSHVDDADADQYSDVFTVDGTELAAADVVTGSQHQQPMTSEDEEERCDEMWDASIRDSTTICGISLDNVEDELESSTNVDDQTNELIHESDVE